MKIEIHTIHIEMSVNCIKHLKENMQNTQLEFITNALNRLY